MAVSSNFEKDFEGKMKMRDVKGKMKMRDVVVERDSYC